MTTTSDSGQPVAGGDLRALPGRLGAFIRRRLHDLATAAPLVAAAALLLALLTYDPADPSANVAVDAPVSNLLGTPGAAVAEILLTWFGLPAFLAIPWLAAWSWRLRRDGRPPRRWWLRLLLLPVALGLAATALAPLPAPASWTLRSDLGGVVGVLGLTNTAAGLSVPAWSVSLAALAGAVALGLHVLALHRSEWRAMAQGIGRLGSNAGARAAAWLDVHRLPRIPMPRVRLPVRRAEAPAEPPGPRKEPSLVTPAPAAEDAAEAEQPAPASPAAPADATAEPVPEAEPAPAAEKPQVKREKKKKDTARAAPPPSGTTAVEAPAPAPTPSAASGTLVHADGGEGYQAPPLELLSPPDPNQKNDVSQDALEQNARQLEQVLADFGVKGEIVKVRPGPVVTRYDLEPAPGTKTSRVVGLADDVARAMAAVSVRIAVVPGSSAIGIELPNKAREVVFLRELLASEDFANADEKLPLILGKDIAGNPRIVDLAKMPHLLVAGTTGSGKSVSVNAMLLSLLYRMSPEQCRMILIDPKMLELSVYADIPHLLSPVVTDPKKAVVALKWTVREMEDRYRKMSRMGVRNIEGYNQRIRQARDNGEMLTRRVQTGFDPDTGQPVHEDQPLEMEPMPYIVIVVDEMADLMLVAGKEIEMAIQRLAQMARAAGIHVIMATQRPSVDVITGTIKANFPTRISFHVTSKVDSRTILGETGAEQLLGQGDMLYMAHGGKITRVHGPLVTDEEVEGVVAHLRALGPPDYVDEVTSEEGDSGTADLMPGGAGGSGDDGGDGDLYDKAVQVVLQHKKASTSFVQRQLQIGYNRAARLIERMESEGVVSPANHVGKREILIDSQGNRE